jgi:porphobilinogen synthase
MSRPTNTAIKQDLVVDLELRHRPRRLRGSATLRSMVRETYLRVDKLVYPLFLVEGIGVKDPISMMPGIFRQSVDVVLHEVDLLTRKGVQAVLLFGIPDRKDAQAGGAWDENGIVQRATREIKRRFPELVIIADTCLCEYMDHGHCGIVESDQVVNDATLALLAKTAVSQALAGADIIAPSDMMDGRVAAIRKALDQSGSTDVPILAYSAKFASALYGPFREAAESAPQFGDRAGYQMDPANGREALKEILLDIDEGADMVMIKPALSYLDIVARAREITNLPIAAYNVSGEYSMVKAAAANGWIDERRVVLETLTGIVRAGADLVITYHAIDVANWLTH